MIYPVFAIRDRVLDRFEPPFCAINVPAAVRSFKNLMEDPASPYYRNTDDYSLFHIGSFDTGTGEIERLTDIVRVSSGGDFVG